MTTILVVFYLHHPLIMKKERAMQAPRLLLDGSATNFQITK